MSLRFVPYIEKKKTEVYLIDFTIFLVGRIKPNRYVGVELF